jgi:hypothetical protein
MVKAKTEPPKRARRGLTPDGRLKRLESEVHKHAEYDLQDKNIYLWVAKSSFVKTFEFARYCNGIKESKANEGDHNRAFADKWRNIVAKPILGYLSDLGECFGDQPLTKIRRFRLPRAAVA